MRQGTFGIMGIYMDKLREGGIPQTVGGRRPLSVGNRGFHCIYISEWDPPDETRTAEKQSKSEQPVIVAERLIICPLPCAHIFINMKFCF